jgi:signal transduction histidine kinase
MSAFPRRATLALAAIVVPTIIVAALGYVSLRQWQRSADVMFREQARDIVSMACDKVEMVLKRAEDELLANLQLALDRGEPVDRAVAADPLVARLDLFDRGGLPLPGSPRAPDPAVLAALLAEVSQGFWERGGRRHFVAGDRPVIAAILRSRDGAPVLAAITRDLDRMRRDVFDTTFGGLEAQTIVAIVDREGRAVWSRGALDRAEPVLTLPFREGLPGWRIALYRPPGASPEASVRRQVMLFSAAFLLLLAMIAVGVVATWRLVRRETEMARLKADFVANVSHDLKTPLSVIRMFAETLELDRVPDAATRREYYRVMTQESERLSRLIENVLDFSRIEGGRRVYARQPTALEPLIRETLEAFTYPLTQQGFKVDVDVAADLPEVAMDGEAIGQALGNLIDNAIKYAGDRKAIRIEARADGAAGAAAVALTVADEGIGIPPGEQERIFEKFYRVGASETQGRRGSGVGLALVRHIVDAHGGSVRVESRPGEGSRFTIRLPVAGRGAAE